MSMAEVVKVTDDEVQVCVTVKLGGSMLENEEHLQVALNAAGRRAMEPILERFDADGDPIHVGSDKLTSRGKNDQHYETPYGVVTVQRHVYQTSRGGRTYCPLEVNGRMVMNATPRYAKMVSSKYCHNGADTVRRDLRESNERKISNNYIKALSDYVGGVAQAKEETWEYALPSFDREVASISIGLDGTCMLMRDDGYREAMCGSIGLYDAEGQRLHTIYAGASPEYGKETFHARFAREVDRVKAEHPHALTIGLADGASDNWSFLEGRTDRQLIDFYHAREYLSQAVSAICPKSRTKASEMETSWSHDLKHKKGAAKRILSAMETELDPLKRGKRKEALRRSTVYFRNHSNKMQYWRHVAENLPVGSGVTEAACKTVIKQRLGCSGMRWKREGASALITIRALNLTPERWQQFWGHIDRWGVPTLN